MEFPKLFAKAKTGKIKQWQVSVDGKVITVLHGQVGGKQTKQTTKITEGKNIGKANETTPHEQAVNEARSKWNKQIDKDYRERVEDIPTSTLPPLAKKFQDFGEALGGSYDVLCKFDGVRCTMFFDGKKVFFQSRGGKEYPEIKEIADDLYEQVWQYHPNMVIDTELYCHGMHLEDITSAVKKIGKDTPKIKAYVFDMFDPSRPEQVWEDRCDAYHEMIDESYYVKVVKAVRVGGAGALCGMITIHDKFVAEGYEGVVLRKLGTLFVFGHRTADFQKYKVPLDKEFKVIRFDVDKNGCAVPICYIDNKVDPKRCEFKAPMVGTHEYSQMLAANQEDYVEGYLKVVFEAYSKYGVPLKPKGHNFREVDEDGNPEV